MNWTWSEVADLLFIAGWCVGVLRWFSGFSWSTKWRAGGLFGVAAIGIYAGLYGSRMPHPQGMLPLVIATPIALAIGGISEHIATREPQKRVENQDRRKNPVGK